MKANIFNCINSASFTLFLALSGGVLSAQNLAQQTYINYTPNNISVDRGLLSNVAPNNPRVSNPRNNVNRFTSVQQNKVQIRQEINIQSNSNPQRVNRNVQMTSIDNINEAINLASNVSNQPLQIVNISRSAAPQNSRLPSRSRGANVNRNNISPTSNVVNDNIQEEQFINASESIDYPTNQEINSSTQIDNVDIAPQELLVSTTVSILPEINNDLAILSLHPISIDLKLDIDLPKINLNLNKKETKVTSALHQTKGVSTSTEKTHNIKVKMRKAGNTAKRGHNKSKYKSTSYKQYKHKKKQFKSLAKWVSRISSKKSKPFKLSVKCFSF